MKTVKTLNEMIDLLENVKEWLTSGLHEDEVLTAMNQTIIGLHNLNEPSGGVGVSDWRDVNKELPAKEDEYDTVDEKDHRVKARYYKPTNEWWVHEGEGYEVFPTHWMPLPLPPKAKKKKDIIMDIESIKITRYGEKKEETWSVTSRDTFATLGYVDRNEKWNRLVFTGESNAIWTSECLQQIVDFLKKQEKAI